MNIIIAHGFAHRLRNDNLVESAPFNEEKESFGMWVGRKIEDMDLSGGDWSVIVDDLTRLRDIFSFVGRRTPSPTVEPPSVFQDASKAL